MTGGATSDVVWLKIPEGYYLAKHLVDGRGTAHLAFHRDDGVWKLHPGTTEAAVATYPGMGVLRCLMEAVRHLSRTPPPID